MDRIKVLIVEDDKSLSDYLKVKMSANGAKVKCADSLGEAQSILNVDNISIVIIERILPDGDGTVWLEGLRRNNNDTPAMILTAVASMSDKVNGLKFADDYLIKPFEFDELWARIQSLLRRYQPQKFGECQ